MKEDTQNRTRRGIAAYHLPGTPPGDVALICSRSGDVTTARTWRAPWRPMTAGEVRRHIRHHPPVGLCERCAERGTTTPIGEEIAGASCDACLDRIYLRMLIGGAVATLVLLLAILVREALR